MAQPGGPSGGEPALKRARAGGAAAGAWAEGAGGAAADALFRRAAEAAALRPAARSGAMPPLACDAYLVRST